MLNEVALDDVHGGGDHALGALQEGDGESSLLWAVSDVAEVDHQAEVEAVPLESRQSEGEV